MDFRTFLLQSPGLSELACAEKFASKWASMLVHKGGHLTRQEQPQTDEFIVVEGCLASSICDPEGKEICVGLHVGPSILTPNIARTLEGKSLVSIQAMTDATISFIDTDALTDLMISSEPIRYWANNALRETLAAKAEREWCLAALGGADRLSWFRKKFPGYEDIFTHSLIASFLGITPVTMSRLRASDRHTL